METKQGLKCTLLVFKGLRLQSYKVPKGVCNAVTILASNTYTKSYRVTEFSL